VKRMSALLLTLLLAFSLTACGGTPAQDTPDAGTDTSASTPADSDTPTADEPSEPAKDEAGNILVAYFSHTGNTEIIANMIAEQTGGDLFHVETTTVYPEEYNDLIAQARQEQDDDARPELASSVEDMDAYDTVFIGYPNWWGTMPMTMFTFLESYDFSGKTVVPFCTHEGSALGSSESDIAELIPDAELLDGLAVRGQTAQNRQDEAREAVTDWLREVGFIE